MWNLFKVNNEDTGRNQININDIVLVISIVNFEKASHIVLVFTFSSFDR